MTTDSRESPAKDYRTWSMPVKNGKLKTILQEVDGYVDAFIIYENDKGEEYDLCCVTTGGEEDVLHCVAWTDGRGGVNELVESWQVLADGSVTSNY